MQDYKKIKRRMTNQPMPTMNEEEVYTEEINSEDMRGFKNHIIIMNVILIINVIVMMIANHVIHVNLIHVTHVNLIHATHANLIHVMTIVDAMTIVNVIVNHVKWIQMNVLKTNVDQNAVILYLQETSLYQMQCHLQ